MMIAQLLRYSGYEVRIYIVIYTEIQAHILVLPDFLRLPGAML